MNKPLLAVVDAFTREPFGGNPAGVLLLEEWPTDQWLQQFAAEMRHSETAFLVKREENHYHLRWFTPTVEMKLCGHATLAAAHVLRENHLIQAEKPILFDSLSGELRVEDEEGRLCLDFPVWQPEASTLSEPILQALGIENATIVKSMQGEEYLIVVDDPSIITSLEPDFEALHQGIVHMYIVTAPGPAPYDFCSRMFAPNLGIDEDPVTGSAHSLLTPYWVERLGKTALKAHQSSERGGGLFVRLTDDRVRIAGDAVTLYVGELTVDPV